MSERYKFRSSVLFLLYLLNRLLVSHQLFTYIAHSMKDKHIFKELIIPFLLKLSLSSLEEFDKFIEHLILTSDMLHNTMFIPEFIESNYFILISSRFIIRNRSLRIKRTRATS